MSVHDRDMWLDSAGGRAFTAMHGSRELAKAALAAAAQSEAVAVRSAIDAHEVAYNRRPPADQVRYHPAVRQDVTTMLSGDARQIRDAFRWTDPTFAINVADELPDAGVSHVMTAPGQRPQLSGRQLPDWQ